MEELIFFAVIILFSIIESISRSRKAKREGEDGPTLPDHPAPEPWEADEAEHASYDTEPSYDELETEPSRSSPTHREGGEAPAGAGSSRAPAPSSETMLPGDLLEELMGLAGRRSGRGGEQRPPERSTRHPVPSTRRHDPSTRRPERSKRPTEPSTGMEPWAGARAPTTGTGPVVRTQPRPSPERMPAPHRVHLSHREYGTDPSERAASLEGRIDPLRERHDPDAAAVHRQLRSHSKSALRRAIILQEVLGPPVALRDERSDG